MKKFTNVKSGGGNFDITTSPVGLRQCLGARSKR